MVHLRTGVVGCGTPKGAWSVLGQILRSHQTPHCPASGARDRAVLCESAVRVGGPFVLRLGAPQSAQKQSHLKTPHLLCHRTDTLPSARSDFSVCSPPTTLFLCKEFRTVPRFHLVDACVSSAKSSASMCSRKVISHFFS